MTDIEKKNSEVLTLKKRISEELDGIDDDIKSLEKAKKKSVEKLEIKKVELKKFTNMQEVCDEHYATLQEIEKASKLIEARKTSITTLDSTIAKLDQEISKIQAEHDKAVAELEKKRRRLNDYLKYYEDLNNKLEKLIGMLGEQEKKHCLELNKLKRERAKTMARTDLSEETLEKTLAELDTRMEDLNKEHGRLIEKISKRLSEITVDASEVEKLLKEPPEKKPKKKVVKRVVDGVEEVVEEDEEESEPSAPPPPKQKKPKKPKEEGAPETEEEEEEEETVPGEKPKEKGEKAEKAEKAKPTPKAKKTKEGEEESVSVDLDRINLDGVDLSDIDLDTIDVSGVDLKAIIGDLDKVDLDTLDLNVDDVDLGDGVDESTLSPEQSEIRRKKKVAAKLAAAKKRAKTIKEQAAEEAKVQAEEAEAEEKEVEVAVQDLEDKAKPSPAKEKKRFESFKGRLGSIKVPRRIHIKKAKQSMTKDGEVIEGEQEGSDYSSMYEDDDVLFIKKGPSPYKKFEKRFEKKGETGEDEDFTVELPGEGVGAGEGAGSISSESSFTLARKAKAKKGRPPPPKAKPKKKKKAKRGVDDDVSDEEDVDFDDEELRQWFPDGRMSTEVRLDLLRQGFQITPSNRIITPDDRVLTIRQAKQLGLFTDFGEEEEEQVDYEGEPEAGEEEKRKKRKRISGKVKYYESPGTSASSLGKASSESHICGRDIEYLKVVFGKSLTIALAELTAVQPTDPVHYLAHWMLKYRYNQEIDQITRIQIQELMIEQERLAAEKWHRELQEEARLAVLEALFRAENIIIQHDFQTEQLLREYEGEFDDSPETPVPV